MLSGKANAKLFLMAGHATTWDTLLVTASQPQFGRQALLERCAFAGLTLGEAAALRVGEVAFTKRLIDFRRQV